MKYIIQHTTLGWCWWDLVALVVLVAVAVFAGIRIKKMKNRKEDLEERLAQMEADQVVDNEVAD